MSEQAFSKWLRSKLPGHVCRVENTIGSGMPDINWCYEGKEIWIETKMTVNSLVLLRKEQWAWMKRRLKEGSNVRIVVGLENNLIACWLPKDVIVFTQGKYLHIEGAPIFMCRRKDFHFRLLVP